MVFVAHGLVVSFFDVVVLNSFSCKEMRETLFSILVICAFRFSDSFWSIDSNFRWVFSTVLVIYSVVISPIPPATSAARIPWSKMLSAKSSIRIDKKLDRKGTYGEQEVLRVVCGGGQGIVRMLGSCGFSTTPVSIGIIKERDTINWRYLQQWMLY